MMAACAADRPLSSDDVNPTEQTDQPDAASPTEPDGGAPPPADASTEADASVQDPSLPLIHDASGASPARVKALVHAALDGLGFDPSAPEGPNPDDRVFIGKHYLAWID